MIKYSNKFNYTIIYYDTENIKYLTYQKSANVNLIFIPSAETPLLKKLALLSNLALNCNTFNMKKNKEVSELKKCDIKILIIPFPSLFGYRNNIPYIVTIPDLMYKYYPNFPEYPLKVRIRRDIEYKNAAKHSVLTVVDSLQGADDLYKFLKIPKGKSRAIPYIPPGYIYKYKDIDTKAVSSILMKYSLPEKFLFYPAQFWYHKNHARLLKAIELIKKKYQIKISLVLVGAPQESYNKIIKLIQQLNLSNQVRYLGYVTYKEIVALYKKSLALIFPDLLGPTNIPPLEAIILGTPIVCSNAFAMPEQIGDAGLLFNPYSIEEIADNIYKIWTDNDLRLKLIKKEKERAKNLILEKYSNKWETIIEESLERINK